MKTLLLLLFILFSCCTEFNQVHKICHSIYEFPHCKTQLIIADNDPNLCDDIQIRLYQDSANFIYHRDFHIEDSTVFIDNVRNIYYVRGELYLIYYYNN